MALVLANRVQESATANTTVSFTLTGAIAGFQSFAVIGDTNTTFYSATDGSGNWEVGLGTYSTTGPTLTRTTIYASSNSNLAVTFSGAVNVFVTYPSGRSVNLDASGNVSALGTVSSGTWQGSTVGVAYGGTGVTASSGANSVVLRDANSNITVNRVSQANTSTTAAGGTTALTAASSYIHTLVGTGGQTYALPDATTLTTGVAFVFNNLATGTLTITDYATATIGTIPSGGAGAVFLTNNGTTGGTWDLHAYLPEGVTFGTNAFNLGSAIVSGGTWQGGTIQPAYGGTGLTTFVGANNALYSTGASTLTAGTLPVAAGGTGRTTYTLNGVLYASGTGTLTNGSALTFDGTSLFVGATSAAAGKMVVKDTSSSNTLWLIGRTSDGASSVSFRNAADSAYNARLEAVSGQLAFEVNGSERMRLTSTGLGIGTSSPNYVATLYKASLPVLQLANAVSGFTSSDGLLIYLNSANATISNEESGSLNFQTSGTLRATIDSSGNLGIGTSSPSYKLDVAGTSTTALTVFGVTNNSSANNTTKTVGAVFRLADTVGFVKDVAYLTAYPDQANAVGGGLTFSTRTADANPSEKMRLDSSGNLGIGTSSPQARLHINSGAGSTQFRMGPNSTSSDRALINYNSTTNRFVIDMSGNDAVIVDGSGNLGLGVTPSAWSVVGPALQVLNATFYGYANQARITANAYFNGSDFKYIASAAACEYRQTGGQHQWLTAPSGTAGNTITFTQAMTLDASGNLGVGTTSPVGRVESRTANMTGSSSVYAQKAFVANIPYSTSNITSSLLAGFDGGSIHGVDVGYAYNGTGYYLAFATNSTVSGSPTERARIDSSGNMGVGTTSPAARLDVVGSTGILTRAAATQDGVALVGRAGGTSSYEVTLTPTTLSADRTLTLPDNSGTVLTSGATVTVAQGGTGATSLTANNVLLGNGTSAVQTVAPGASGNVLTSNGTTWTSAAAGPPTITAGANYYAVPSGLRASVNSSSYQKINQYRALVAGTYRILAYNEAPYYSSCVVSNTIRFYKNGVAVSAEYTSTSSAKSLVTYDMTVVAGDLVQLYSKNSFGAGYNNAGDLIGIGINSSTVTQALMAGSPYPNANVYA